MTWTKPKTNETWIGLSHESRGWGVQTETFFAAHHSPFRPLALFGGTFSREWLTFDSNETAFPFSRYDLGGFLVLRHAPFWTFRAEGGIGIQSVGEEFFFRTDLTLSEEFKIAFLFLRLEAGILRSSSGFFPGPLFTGIRAEGSPWSWVRPGTALRWEVGDPAQFFTQGVVVWDLNARFFPENEISLSVRMSLRSDYLSSYLAGIFINPKKWSFEPLISLEFGVNALRAPEGKITLALQLNRPKKTPLQTSPTLLTNTPGLILLAPLENQSGLAELDYLKTVFPDLLMVELRKTRTKSEIKKWEAGGTVSNNLRASPSRLFQRDGSLILELTLDQNLKSPAYQVEKVLTSWKRRDIQQLAREWVEAWHRFLEMPPEPLEK